MVCVNIVEILLKLVRHMQNTVVPDARMMHIYKDVRYKRTLKDKKCVLYVEKNYVAKKKDSIYCSNACKQKAYRTKKNVTV